MKWTRAGKPDPGWSESAELGPLTLAIFGIGKHGPLGPCKGKAQWVALRKAGEKDPIATHITQASGYGRSTLAGTRVEAVQQAIVLLRSLKRRTPKKNRKHRDIVKGWMNEARKWLSEHNTEDPTERPRVLILSCARSGTKYMAEVLTACGLEVGHEAAGKDVTIGWPYAGGQMADFDGFDAYDLILHQVRNPLDTIGSCHTLTLASWTAIAGRLSLFEVMKGPARPENLLQRCMAYWVGWNRICEAKASMTYHVEGLDSITNDTRFHIARSMEISEAVLDSAILDTAKTTNTRPHPDVTWEMMEDTDSDLTASIAAMVVNYRYTDERTDDGQKHENPEQDSQREVLSGQGGADEEAPHV